MSYSLVFDWIQVLYYYFQSTKHSKVFLSYLDNQISLYPSCYVKVSKSLHSIRVLQLSTNKNLLVGPYSLNHLLTFCKLSPSFSISVDYMKSVCWLTSLFSYSERCGRIPRHRLMKKAIDFWQTPIILSPIVCLTTPTPATKPFLSSTYPLDI